MYRKVSLSSFHNGKVEYCAIFGSGDIDENASAIFFTQTLSIYLSIYLYRYIPGFLEKLDAGSGKSQKFISMIIEREHFMKILAKLVKNALKTGFFWISRKSGSKIQNSF